MEGYGPVIAAAIAGGNDAVACSQGPPILPIVLSRSPELGPESAGGKPSLTLQQQQSSDLYSWLFGSSSSPAHKTAGTPTDAAPEDSQTLDHGPVFGLPFTAASLTPAGGLEGVAEAPPGLPVVAMETQASQLAQQEAAAERCMPWSPRPGPPRHKELISPQSVRFRESPLPLDKRWPPVAPRQLLTGYRWGLPASPPRAPISRRLSALCCPGT